ncbi:MAG: MFS transporter [Terriglobales bacterium]|jgi:MFS family permease
MASPATQGSEERAGYVAFSSPDFLLFQAARFFIVAALEMQSVAIGWQVYEITKKPLDLGLVGLAQFLPGIFLFLAAGHVADRFSRRSVLLCCYAGFGMCSSLLLVLALRTSPSVLMIYAVVLLLGVVRTFNGPAGRAILPQLVPIEHFPNAVTWNATTFQAATISGPALGGLLYAVSHGPRAVYGGAILAAITASVLMWSILPRAQAARNAKTASVFAGFRYVWKQKLILALISLDMFAVLLGGAVALLPVYAREILHIGPWGLGILRSSPAVGAAIMAFFLAHNPLRKNVGSVMLWCVGGFGVFTIVFGLSRSIPLSLLALLLSGAFDMVSVVIRGTLVQLATPDEMRGRVTAVDMIFIGTSNELGQFESGLTAAWFGTVPAVVLGGIGTLCVIGVWAWIFPELREANEMTGEKAEA